MAVELSPSQLRTLIALHGSRRRAAVAAMQHPEYEEEFRDIGAYLIEMPDGQIIPWFDAKVEAYFWQLVVAAVASDDEMPAPAAEPVPRRIGPPLKPVMRVDDARQLQAVIDRARQNGNELVIADLAKRFRVSRKRIYQAIAKRERREDLFLSVRNPGEDTNTTDFVYWVPEKKPRKS